MKKENKKNGGNNVKSSSATVQEIELSKPHINFYNSILRTTFESVGLEDSQIETRLSQITELCTSHNASLLISEKSISLMTKVKNDIEKYLLEQAFLKNLIRVQSIARRWLVVGKFKDLSRTELQNIRQYNRGIMELIRTERDYVTKLANVCNNVVGPLRKMEADPKQKLVVLNKGDVQTLFWNMEQILHLHLYLLQSMESIVDKSWPFCVNLSSPFTKLIPSFGLYGDYVEHYQAALSKLKDLQKQPKFNLLLQENKIDANLMLLLPLNRIPDYNLILDGLVRMSPFDNQEMEELVLIHTIIKESANLLKQKLLHSEHFAENERIQKSIVNFEGEAINMDKNRIYIKEFNLTTRHLFLFNDIILFCKPLKKGCKLIERCELENIQLIDIPDQTNKYGFEIKVPNTVKKPLQAFCKSKEEKNRVFKELHRIITDKQIRGLDSEGIFRVEGGSSSVQELRKALDRNPQQSLIGVDVYELGQVMKQFFRELPIPLIPFDFYDKLISIQRQMTTFDPNSISNSMNDSKDRQVEFLEKLRFILHELPSNNFRLLEFLTQFLLNVSQHSKVNKMTTQNLAIVFGPNLLRPKEQTFQTSVDIPLVYNIVQTMIEEGKLVFGETPITSSLLANRKNANIQPTHSGTKENNRWGKTAATLKQKKAFVAVASRLQEDSDRLWDEPGFIPPPPQKFIKKIPRNSDGSSLQKEPSFTSLPEIPSSSPVPNRPPPPEPSSSFSLSPSQSTTPTPIASSVPLSRLNEVSQSSPAPSRPPPPLPIGQSKDGMRHSVSQETPSTTPKPLSARLPPVRSGTQSRPLMSSSGVVPPVPPVPRAPVRTVSPKRKIERDATNLALKNQSEEQN